MNRWCVCMLEICGDYRNQCSVCHWFVRIALAASNWFIASRSKLDRLALASIGHAIFACESHTESSDKPIRLRFGMENGIIRPIDLWLSSNHFSWRMNRAAKKNMNVVRLCRPPSLLQIDCCEQNAQAIQSASWCRSTRASCFVAQALVTRQYALSDRNYCRNLLFDLSALPVRSPPNP